MDIIKINYETDVQTRDLIFETRVNDTIVVNHTTDSTIDIEATCLFGINQLKITLLSDISETVRLTGMTINGVSSRHTFYLAYSEESDNKTCNTWFSQHMRSINIPFGNPLSWWLSYCAKKIPNSYYGTDLYKSMDIYIPTSLQINENFSVLLQDFMKYNFDFHVCKNDEPILHNKNIPWHKINLEYDEEMLFNEFLANIEFLRGEPAQNQYTKIDDPKMELWQVSFAVSTDKQSNHARLNFDPDQFPKLVELLTRIQRMGIKIIHAFVGTVNAGSVVAPHTDDFYKHDMRYENTPGCSQFFIPIGWKEGNHFKFDGVGFLPWQDGAHIVNNSDFSHGSINESDDVRFTIGIYCDFTEQNIKDLIMGVDNGR